MPPAAATPLMPWDRRAPEREGPPAAWALLPEDLAALGCPFCATGAMGIVRNLTAGEIVGQALALMHELGPQRGEYLYIVFMGMGEPLHNLDHVHRAITVLCHPAGTLLSPWRITVSTAG